MHSALRDTVRALLKEGPEPATKFNVSCSDGSDLMSVDSDGLMSFVVEKTAAMERGSGAEIQITIVAL